MKQAEQMSYGVGLCVCMLCRKSTEQRVEGDHLERIVDRRVQRRRLRVSTASSYVSHHWLHGPVPPLSPR